MGRGRHSYPKIKVSCRCGWKGIRSTFMARKKCPRCGERVQEQSK